MPGGAVRRECVRGQTTHPTPAQRVGYVTPVTSTAFLMAMWTVNRLGGKRQHGERLEHTPLGLAPKPCRMLLLRSAPRAGGRSLRRAWRCPRGSGRIRVAREGPGSLGV